MFIVYYIVNRDYDSFIMSMMMISRSLKTDGGVLSIVIMRNNEAWNIKRGELHLLETIIMRMLDAQRIIVAKRK